MKKIAFIFLMTATLLQVACNSSQSDPKAVGREWIDAMYQGKWEKAEKISTLECQQLIKIQSGFVDLQADSMKQSYKKTKWEFVGEPAIEGNNATLTYRESGFPEPVILPLVKVDNKWMVNLTKDTYQEQKEGEGMPESGEEAVQIGTDSINAGDKTE
ncbi:MAG: hypothetical protein RL660_527 [Bacteroidota bacterium]|jgi:hypothetical protein